MNPSGGMDSNAVLSGAVGVPKSVSDMSEDSALVFRLGAGVGRMVAGLARRPLRTGLLLFALGVAWIALFPVVCVTTGELKCRGTYFSENALSTGLSITQFGASGFHQALGKLKEQQSAGKNSRDVMIESMVWAGLEVDPSLGQDILYGTLWPRNAADRREAVILVVQSDLTSNNDRVSYTQAVAIGLSKVLSTQEWLSKVFLLVVCEGPASLNRWLAMYHGDRSRGSLPLNMSRPGAIIGGLVLDLGAGQDEQVVTAIEILAPGAGGMLPNLDLVNVVVKLAKRGGIPTRLHQLPENSYLSATRQYFVELARELVGRSLSYSFLDWAQRVENTLHFLRSVAFGPTGLHAALLPYNIHALTLRAEMSRLPGRGAYETSKNIAVHFGSTAESTFRSLSNLEEKFHQSYFLYVLPDLGLFVSIGEYFGSLLLILGPLVFAFLSWVIPGETRVRETSQPLEDPVFIFMSACALVAIAFLPGVALVSFPDQVTVTPVLAAVLVFTQLLLRLALALLDKGPREPLLAATKALMCSVVVIMHVMIGMVAYPLALCGALLLSPLYSVIRRPSSSIARIIMLLAWAGCAVAFVVLFPNLIATPSLWPDVAKSGLLPSLLEMQRIFPGSLHFVYVALVLLPSHSLALTILLA